MSKKISFTDDPVVDVVIQYKEPGTRSINTISVNEVIRMHAQQRQDRVDEAYAPSKTLAFLQKHDDNVSFQLLLALERMRVPYSTRPFSADELLDSVHGSTIRHYSFGFKLYDDCGNTVRGRELFNKIVGTIATKIWNLLEEKKRKKTLKNPAIHNVDHRILQGELTVSFDLVEDVYETDQPTAAAAAAACQTCQHHPQQQQYAYAGDKWQEMDRYLRQNGLPLKPSRFERYMAEPEDGGKIVISGTDPNSTSNASYLAANHYGKRTRLDEIVEMVELFDREEGVNSDLGAAAEAEREAVKKIHEYVKAKRRRLAEEKASAGSSDQPDASVETPSVKL
jgi:hypothetical protein